MSHRHLTARLQRVVDGTMISPPPPRFFGVQRCELTPMVIRVGEKSANFPFTSSIAPVRRVKLAGKAATQKKNSNSRKAKRPRKTKTQMHKSRKRWACARLDVRARDRQKLAAADGRLRPAVLVVCVRDRLLAAGIDDGVDRVIDLADDVRHLT